MPALPRYERQVATPLRVQNNPTGVDTSQGDALRFASRAASAAGSAFSAIDGVLLEADKTRSKEADVKLNEMGKDTFFNPDTGYFGLKGEAALKAREATLERLTKAREEASKGLSGRALRQFNQTADVRMNEWKSDVDQWAQKQELVYRDATSISRQQSAGDDFVRWVGVDDERAEAAWGTAATELTTRLRDNVSDDPDLIMQQLNKEKGSLYAKAVRARIGEDPKKALMLLDVAKGYMDPVEEAQLRTLVNGEVIRRDANAGANGEATGTVPTTMTEASPALLAAMEGKESAGQVGILGPKVKTDAGEEQAAGLLQVLPSTGRELAAELGIEYRPDLMTGKTKEAAAYQRSMGAAYMNKMLKANDGNVVLALASYNAGPGVVEDWLNGTNKTGKNKSLRKLPDPRKTGNDAAFVAAIPFAETKDYVQVITSKAGMTNEGLPKGDLSQEEVYAWADKAAGSPSDPLYDDRKEAFRAAGIKEWRQREAVKAERRSDAAEKVQAYIAPGGLAKSWTDIPSEIWTELSPEAQTSIKAHYVQGERQTDPLIYTNIYNMAATQPEAFKTADLTPLISKMTASDYQEIVKLQRTYREDPKAAKAQEVKLSDIDAVSKLVVPKGWKDGDEKTVQFKAAFLQAAQAKAAQLGREPNQGELLDIGRRLNNDVVTGEGVFGPKRTQVYKTFGSGVPKDDFYAIPEPIRKKIVQDWKAKNSGALPSYEQAVDTYRRAVAAGIL